LPQGGGKSGKSEGAFSERALISLNGFNHIHIQKQKHIHIQKQNHNHGGLSEILTGLSKFGTADEEQASGFIKEKLYSEI